MASHQFDEKAIFKVASSIESLEARRDYLNQVCGNNDELHNRVVRLLRMDEEDPSFLASPLVESDPTMDFAPIAERPGTEIGHYKLLQEIGEGGMGVVYMAHQREPVRRKVALKIIKPGMDTREVVSRFEAERQALAMMDHPNIAKVLDAGATESGRPYFVMELVNGVPATEYCDDNSLTTDERLELFISVCNAVQHAHQKGIIHRDIKPTNILVTLHDGVPVPKVIDFGIAKAIHQELTANTTYTGFGQIVGTPVYMSPEQAELGGLDVDTRSDIYSLGVLLYELLTGTTPFDQKQLKEAGLDEMRRLIREQEPERPSTRVSTMGKAATTMSEYRKSSPAELSHTLRQEVDWIVMKALEKDRTRRYETAADFARDIQRYLNDEAVVACPPSTMYRLRKFTRRNRVAVWTTAAIGLALILGAAVAAGQAYRATQAERLANEQLEIAGQQRRLADAARTQAESVTDYLVNAFRSPDPQNDGRTVTVAEVLDRAAQDVAKRFIAQPELKAQLLFALGETYSGLGLANDAIPLLEQCRDIRGEVLGREHPDTLMSLTSLVTAYWRAERNEEAVKLAAESFELHRKVFGPDHLRSLQDSESNICALIKNGDTDAAIQLGEQQLRLAGGTLGPEHATTLEISCDLGLAYSENRQYGKAIEILEEARKMAPRILGAEHPDMPYIIHNLGVAYAKVGRFEEASKLQEEAFKLSHEVLGPVHPMTLNCLASQGFTLSAARQYVEAAAVYEEAWKIQERALGPASVSTVKAMLNLVVNQRMAGRFEPAMRLSPQALRISIANFGPRDRNTITAWRSLVRVLLDTGHFEAAARLLDKIVPMFRETHGPQHSDTRWLTMHLATAYAALGRHDEAIQLGQEHLRKSKSWMGMLYSAVGRYEEAIALLEEVLPAVREQYGSEDQITLDAMERLANAYEGVGRLDEAMGLYQTLLSQQRKTLGEDHPQALASMIPVGRVHAIRDEQADAERLLLAAYEGFARRYDSYPTPYDGTQAAAACTELIQLYEKSDQADKMAEWKETLAAITESLNSLPAWLDEVDKIIASLDETSK